MIMLNFKCVIAYCFMKDCAVRSCLYSYKYLLGEIWKLQTPYGDTLALKHYSSSQGTHNSTIITVKSRWDHKHLKLEKCWK